MILKKLLKKISPYVMFGTAWIVILAVLLLGERISGPLASALYAVGGILLRGGGDRPEPHPDVPGAAEGVRTGRA